MARYITLVGKRAAGKDTFCSYALEKYGIPSISFSDIIMQLGSELGLVKPEEMQDKAKAQYVGNMLRAKYGERFYTEKLARAIEGRDYIINGLRHPAELTCLREILSHVVVVGLQADKQKRYERAKRIGIVSSLKDFEELEANPSEANIDLLIAKADFILTNNGKLKEFHEKIDRLLFLFLY